MKTTLKEYLELESFYSSRNEILNEGIFSDLLTVGREINKASNSKNKINDTIFRKRYVDAKTDLKKELQSLPADMQSKIKNILSKYGIKDGVDISRDNIKRYIIVALFLLALKALKKNIEQNFSNLITSVLTYISGPLGILVDAILNSKDYLDLAKNVKNSIISMNRLYTDVKAEANV